MSSPPVGPRDRSPRHDPTWNDILVSWSLVAAIPVLLWALSAPLVAAVAVTAAGGLILAGRRALWLADCLRNCRSLSVHLGRDVHVVVGDPCPDGAT